MPLQPDQVLRELEYSYGGEVYQVGEFAEILVREAEKMPCF